MPKTELRKIYKKRISFDSSPLGWLLKIVSALLILMFILELTLEESLKNIVLGIMFGFLILFALLMLYFVFREELQRIKTAQKELIFEFTITDTSLVIAQEYLTSKKYVCTAKRGTTNSYKYENNSSSYFGNFILHIAISNNKIRLFAYVKNISNNISKRKRKHGLYGMILYPAKVKFRKHLAVVLELLKAPEELKI